jgi:hypothetical protein
VVFAGLVLIFSLPSLSHAWTDSTRLRMVQDALKVSPPALNVILDRYREDLRRGMIEPSRREGEEVHFQHGDGSKGMGAAGVARKVEEVRGILESRGSLRRFAYEMGTLAHLMSDVGFPLNAADSDPREPLYREAYRLYVERSLDRIPFVFEPGGPVELSEGDLEGFVMARARQAARSYDLIGPAFRDDGTAVSRDALDERSIPFGIASVSYSQATSDIVRLWRYVWVSVNGDLSGTPHLDTGDSGRQEQETP